MHDISQALAAMALEMATVERGGLVLCFPFSATAYESGVLGARSVSVTDTCAAESVQYPRSF